MSKIRSPVLSLIIPIKRRSSLEEAGHLSGFYLFDFCKFREGGPVESQLRKETNVADPVAYDWPKPKTFYKQAIVHVPNPKHLISLKPINIIWFATGAGSFLKSKYKHYYRQPEVFKHICKRSNAINQCINYVNDLHTDVTEVVKDFKPAVHAWASGKVEKSLACNLWVTSTYSQFNHSPTILKA